MRTVAVDWSGRKKGAARHIWAAELAAGELVALSNGRTASQLADWLVDQANGDDRLAVGLDFAFSVPAWYLRSLGVAGAPELWEAGARKDTVVAYPGEITRVKATYDRPGLFVWHCHIVEHEDHEMMRPYQIGP